MPTFLIHLLVATCTTTDPPTREGPLDVPPVVITGTRRPERPLEAPVSVDAVPSKTLETKQATTAADAIEATPGVFMQRSNSGAGAPIIRGLIGPQNLYLIDGVRLSNSVFRTGPNQYLNLMDPTGVERYEVLRGASSVLHGNGAMGGVVQALTLDPRQEPWWIRARARAHTAAVGGGGEITVSNHWLLAEPPADPEAFVPSIGLIAGGGFDSGSALRIGGGDEVPLSNLDTAGWRFKLLWEPTRALEVRAAYLGSVLNNQGRVDDLGKGDVRIYDNIDHLAYVRVVYQGDVLRFASATFSYHRFEEDTLRSTCATVDVPFGSGTAKVVADRARCTALDDATISKKTSLLDTVDTYGGDVAVELAFLDDRLRVLAGAELYGDLVSSGQSESKKGDDGTFGPDTAKPRGAFSDGSDYLSVGAFAHVDGTPWRFGPGLELRLGGGLRVSHFSAAAPDVPELGDVDYDFTGVALSASMQVVMPRVFNVYASFLQGFRAPNLQETTVLGDTGSRFEIPNAELEPERSNTIELGAKMELYGVTLGLAWYYSVIDDLITDQSATWLGSDTAGDGDKPVSQRVNADSGHIQGVELSASARFWQFTLAYAMTYTTGEVEIGGETVPFRRLPPLFGDASLRYDLPGDKAFIALGVAFAARQDELNPADEKDARICETAPYSGLLEADCDGTPGSAILNLSAGFRLSPFARVDMAILNLLDARYRRHGSGYDGAGIDTKLQFTLEF
ncbi:MAG: TonB-dependent receptor [Myxococcales bacterium]|nr:TonB-dependent receptor [Myxococcales bacterium]